MIIDIKVTTPPDAKTLSDLGRKTFVDTFAKDNSKEDMDIYTALNFGIEIQHAEIVDSKRSISIAWVSGIPAGFYHLVESSPDASVAGERPIELLRLYVDSLWHGKGLGPALMKDCIAVARSKGFKTIWLGVWEKNFKAQAFYRKHSFVVVGQHTFTLGKDKQNDIIMSRQI